eukprot:g6327.t1
MCPQTRHMERRRRLAWLIISCLWVVACVVVLYERGPTRLSQNDGGGGRQTNVVVLVMPSPPMVSGPSTRIDRLTTIRTTWGQDLVDNGYHSVVFVVDEADTATVEEALKAWGALEADPLSADGEKSSRPHQEPKSFRVVVVPDEISKGGVDGDGRLRYVLGRVSEAYDPAFLFYCNEHTFVIAENLACYVGGLDPSEPRYLGNRFRKEEEERDQDKPLLNSGAAGFVLTRASLTLLTQAWEGSGVLPEEEASANDVQLSGRMGDATSSGGVVAPECVAKSKFELANPGLTLARCLRHVGVNAEDTTDSQGGQRFNAYGPARLAQGNIDQWYKDVHASDPGMWRAGLACCASDTVSFHYVGPAEARAMHRILHHRETYLTEGYTEALSLWPATPQALGPYAGRPKPGDVTFDLLLRKIQVCSA